jgi:drug/metabolite transporter (DMT)-like permease
MSLKTTANSGSLKTAYVALLLVQIIFGFNYAASRVILEQYPPVFWGGIRMFLAGLIMLGLSFFIVPKTERKIDREFLWKTFFYGFFGMALNQAFFMLGLFKTTTANAAILNTMTPIFTLLFAIMAKQEGFTARRGLGFFIAILGAVVIRRFEDFQLSSETFQGDLYTVLNCVALAIFFTISRDFLRKTNPFWATAWMFLFGGAVLLAVTIPQGHSFMPQQVSSTFLWAVFYNVVAAAIVTYFLNSWSLTKVNASSVALFIYLQPVIAVVNGYFTYGEQITTRMAIAMFCIFFGVGLGVMKKKT